MDLGRDLFTVNYDQDTARVTVFLQTIEALGFEPSVVESGLDRPALPKPDQLPETVRSYLNQDKAVLVYFGARWCGACKIMERTTFADAGISAKLEEFGFLKVDVEADPEIASAFLISAVPTIVILTSDGAEAYRRVGPLNREEMDLVLAEFVE